MHLYRIDLFPDLSHYAFLYKIQQYHDETHLPIYVVLKSIPRIQSSILFSNMKQHLDHHHITLVREYLPPSLYKIARETYRRFQYRLVKAKRLFLEQALRQIQDYDDFYLTMDDIHEIDSVMTSLLYQELYYRE